MVVTPLEIKKKEFRRCFRGYDDQEVDAFLDQVAAAIEALTKENDELKDIVERAEQNISSYQELENALKQTMVFAQKNAQEMKDSVEKETETIRREARAEAEAIRREATLKAEQVLAEAGNKAEEVIQRAHRQAEQSLDEARLKLEQLLQEYRQLKKHVKAFRDKFRSFLETQLELLEDQELGVAREIKAVMPEETEEAELEAVKAEPEPETRQLKPIAGGKS